MTVDPSAGSKRSSAIQSLLALGFVAAMAAATVATGAQEKPPPAASHPKKDPSGLFKASQACGSGVEALLTSATAVQGGLVLVEVRSAHPLAEVKADWNGKVIPFWEISSSPARQRALLGVDLDLDPAPHDLKIQGQSANVGPFSCTVAVAVTPGKFRTERLTVEKKFAEPSPEQLEEAEADSKRLRALFATVTPEKLWNGRFRIPLNGVKTGGNFGRRRVLNGISSSPHTGVDMRAPLGTPVYAAQSGRVALAEKLYFAGNTVVLDHGFGIYTLYAHFESVAVHEGEMVKKGQRLGKSGATGRVTGPHLHWGLVVDGARVNALQIVRVLPG